MLSFRNVCEVVGTHVSSAKVREVVWPSNHLFDADALSLRKLCEQFDGPGASLRQLRTNTASSPWKSVDRKTVASDIRDRVADPAVINQVDTSFCGPAALAFEFARRDPVGYVEFVRSLFEQGRVVARSGREIKVDKDLLGGKYPSPTGTGNQIRQGDWLLCASLRDDENWFWDVDGDKSKGGWSGGLTTVAEMAGWTEDVLGLKAAVDRPTLGFLGEDDMLRRAGKQVISGGVAFLCIDGALVKDGKTDDEEQVEWMRTRHLPGSEATASGWTRSADDFATATHWVVLLSNVIEKGPNVELTIWSWGAEYRLRGTMDSVGEYLHAAVLGHQL